MMIHVIILAAVSITPEVDYSPQIKEQTSITRTEESMAKDFQEVFDALKKEGNVFVKVAGRTVEPVTSFEPLTQGTLVKLGIVQGKETVTEVVKTIDIQDIGVRKSMKSKVKIKTSGS